MSKRDRQKRPGQAPADSKQASEAVQPAATKPVVAPNAKPPVAKPAASTPVVAKPAAGEASKQVIAKPATPVAKTATPVVKPAPAAAKPAPAALKPTATKPATPAAKPAAPAAKPQATKPIAPAAKPVAPAAKPVAPATKPVAPAAKPVAAPVSAKSQAKSTSKPASANGAANGQHAGTFAQPAPVTTPSAAAGQALPEARDPGDVLTMAPPAKRQRASQPRITVPTVTGEADAPHEPFTGDNRAASAEPPLEVAASIAVSSDRADSEAAARLSRSSSGDRLREAAAFGSSQSLLSTDYYFRQYGAHGVRSMVAEVDDFGFDPHVDNKVRPLLEALCKRYFRVELVGAEHIPASGRALLVANRAGALPWDGLVLRTALRAQRPELSSLRWLAEDSVIHYPFMGVFMNRLGAVRACPENAERLLAQDRLVAVFPEGAQGSRKLFRDRYRLQRFGRGGYVKLALKLGVPIFPTAIIGAEEINPVLGRSRLLGRILGSDSVPLTPTFPWLGLAGLLPAPVRWRIAVGAPIDLSSYGPEAADDALIVHRLNEQIRSSLQSLVDQGKSARGSALFG